jgi:protein phosphatase
MLVCPGCQFENSEASQLCQDCGTPLHSHTCPQCGADCALDQLNCGHCGSQVGITRRVIWSQATPLPPIPSKYKARYGFVGLGQVLDRQPFHSSEFQDWLRSHIHPESTPVLDPILQPSPQGRILPLALLDSRFPQAVQPYISLRSALYQAIPAVIDAWHAGGSEVLILEDRPELVQLSEVMQQPGQFPPVQILHWLYELTELWTLLEPWRACSSLLVSENLCLDEDQTLCLQQIYIDTIDSPLSELGRLWRTRFSAAIAWTGSLKHLLEAMFEAMESGQLTTIQAVNAQLTEIVETLPNAYFETTMTTDPHSSGVPSPYSSPDPEPTRADLANSDLANDDVTTPLGRPAEPGAQVPQQEMEPLAQGGLGHHLGIALDVAGRPRDLAGDLTGDLTGDLAGDVAEEEFDTDSEDQPTIVLPMQLFNLEDTGRTDIGQQRDHNEDFFGIESQMVRLEGPAGRSLSVRNLYVLCDGMGGHAGGEVASALGVNTLRHYFRDLWRCDPLQEDSPNKLPSPEAITQAIHLVNTAIYEENQNSARSGSGRMGTTLVAMLVQDTEVAVVHVGDSRLYRYTRKRGLEQLTVDHEVGQREIQRGVEPDIAYARPDAYQLTQALGPRDDAFVKPDVQYFAINEDALFLLCSDGITDNELLEAYCESHIHPLLSSQANLEQGVKQLIDLANQYNGHDNITLLAVRAKVRPNLSAQPR